MPQDHTLFFPPTALNQTLKVAFDWTFFSSNKSLQKDKNWNELATFHLLWFRKNLTLSMINFQYASVCKVWKLDGETKYQTIRLSNLLSHCLLLKYFVSFDRLIGLLPNIINFVIYYVQFSHFDLFEDCINQMQSIIILDMPNQLYISYILSSSFMSSCSSLILFNFLSLYNCTHDKDYLKRKITLMIYDSSK